MNKREKIIIEAKRLFGHYGYLGFTLKLLAEACDMTSPAMYYFYSSKADLFYDCMLSELEARKVTLENCAAHASTLAEFGRALAYQAIDVCDASKFITGHAMDDIVHLPQEMQHMIMETWKSMLLEPVETFLARVHPEESPVLSRRLQSTFIISIACFSAKHVTEFTRDELAALFVAVCEGLDQTVVASRS